MEITDTIQPEVTSPLQRMQWNDYLDNLNGQEASPETMATHQQANPDFSITPEMIPQIQAEHADIRNGASFGDLGEDKLNAIRPGMSDNFRNSTNLSQSYYPTFKMGSQDYGTDIERYANAKVGLAAIPTEGGNISASSPSSANPLPITEPTTSSSAANNLPDGAIPRPNWSDTTSRTQYLQQWAKKHGDLQGRGDTIMKINEVPRSGSDTMGNIAVKIGKKYDIDPALLHSSAMEEGASELFKDKSGLDTKHRKPSDFGYMGNYGDKDFPVNGPNSFGLPDFANRFPELVAGGYLPKNFQDKFRGKKGAGEFGENNFKTVEDAMTAKAALMKFGNDYVQKEAQKNGVTLSPAQKDFFTLAWFNGGEGAVLKRVPQYKQQGYLKNDNFINQRPKEEQGKPDNLDVWGHVTRRIKMRDNLKSEGFF